MVPDCSLDCKNGGECILGITSFDQEHDLVHLFDNTDEFQRCECPAGYGGKLCETPRIECGEHHCFNGGSCLTRDINGETKHHCDCSTAAMGDYLFAGRFCQYQSSSICTPKESENGELFCVNGGSCKSESHEGCTCPDGYYGHSCEFKTAPAGDTSDSGSGSDNDGSTSFPEVTTCSLTCENGGVCRNGKKDLGLIDEISQGVAELNPTHDENFEHCACPDGFVGLQVSPRSRLLIFVAKSAPLPANGSHTHALTLSLLIHHRDMSLLLFLLPLPLLLLLLSFFTVRTRNQGLSSW